MKRDDGIAPINAEAWAIGTITPRNRVHVRRVVWGHLMATMERRQDEKIWRAYILVRPLKSRKKAPTSGASES
jgi:hypothetical protein